jgi:hypothetical protein
VYNARLAAEIQSFVADALRGLIHQFADPMACFREMVQNAVDAGSAEIDVRFEYAGGRLVATSTTTARGWTATSSTIG